MPHLRNNCLKLLYGACASHALLPTSLQVELEESLTGIPLCRGGSGEVHKCEYRGQQVAVKVLKVYANEDLQKVAHVSCWNPRSQNGISMC